MGCPIRVPADQRLLTAPRGLSQPSAPFIGPRRQGIHRAPVVAQQPCSRTTPSRQDRLTSTTLHLSKVSKPYGPRPNHPPPHRRSMPRTNPDPTHRTQPNKKRPAFGPHHARTRLPLALHPPLQFEPIRRANRRAPCCSPRARAEPYILPVAPRALSRARAPYFSLRPARPAPRASPRRQNSGPTVSRTAPRPVPAAPPQYIGRPGDFVKGSGDPLR